MSRIPVATELGRKDRLWPAVAASIAAHALAIAFAVRASSLPEIQLEQTPLQAKLVRLGEKKPEAQLPRKDAPPPEPAPAAPVVAETPPPPPDTPPPPAALPPPEPARALQPAPARAGTTRARGAGTSSVDSLLERTQRQIQQERLSGDPEGDPEGDSETGEGDPYLARLANAVQRNYRLPATVSGQKLAAVFVLWIEPDGRIVRSKLQKPSGNPSFDGGVERAIHITTAPRPPKDRVEAYRTTGVQVTFYP